MADGDIPGICYPKSQLNSAATETRRPGRHEPVPEGAGDESSEPSELRRPAKSAAVHHRQSALPQLPRGQAAASLVPTLTPYQAIHDGEECRVAAAIVLSEISCIVLEGKGIDRFRDWQDCLIRNSMILVVSGTMPYDKLIERAQDLEIFIKENGGMEAAQTSTQEGLKSWLNGGDDDREAPLQ